jgi:hypothetical protein
MGRQPGAGPVDTGKDGSWTDRGGPRSGSPAEAQAGRRCFPLLLCSPLRRARDTGEEAGFGDHAVLCDELREWDYGDHEGLTTAEVRTRDPGWDRWRDGCPGDERPGQVGARVDRVLALVPGARHVLIFARMVMSCARWLPGGCSWSRAPVLASRSAPALSRCSDTSERRESFRAGTPRATMTCSLQTPSQAELRPELGTVAGEPCQRGPITGHAPARSLLGIDPSADRAGPGPAVPPAGDHRDPRARSKLA